MPGINRTRSVGVAVDEDEDQIKEFCDHIACKGKKHLLTDLEDGSPDADEFYYCRFCHNKPRRGAVKKEGELYSDLEIIETPYDFAKVQADPIKPKNRYQALKKKQEPKVDPEIQLEIKKGAEVTYYEKL